MHVIVVVIVVVYDVSTEHVASSILLLVCQVVCDLVFVACVSNSMFYN